MEKIPEPGRPSPDRSPGVPATSEPEGGESACFAHLVCEECGALGHEGHRDGCSAATAGAERSR